MSAIEQPTRGRRPKRRWHPALFLLPAMLCLASCRADVEPEAARAPPGAESPVEAVTTLTGHLHQGDLVAFAYDALPAALAAEVDAAWRSGQSRWPLSEIPLSSQLPAMLTALNAPQAESILLQLFDHEFAGAEPELRSAAIALGAFAVQFLEQDGQFSEHERAHYTQLVAATSDWAAQAPLADRTLARETISALVAATRESGLDSDAALGKAGMQAGLTTAAPLFRAGKQRLSAYGLDLDSTFASVEATLDSQTGDTALVRLQYTIAGAPVDALIDVERHDGRWFVSDFIRHARNSAQTPASPAASTGTVTMPAP